MKLDNYKRIFKDSGLKKKELSEITGVSPNYLRQLERDDANPTISFLKDFADKLKPILEISILDFFTPDQIGESKYYTLIVKGSEDHLINKDVIDENTKLKNQLLSERGKIIELYERMDKLQSDIEVVKTENLNLIKNLESLKGAVQS